MVASQYLSQDDLFYIYILNTINGEVIRKFPVVNKMGLVEPFSDGSNIFTDDRNGNISIFNLETKTYFTSQTDDGCAIFHIKMTKNNKAITASCDYLDIWNSNAEKICSLSIDELWPTNQDSDNSIQSISLLDDEKTALILRKNFPEGDTIEIIDVCGKSILNSMAIGDYRTSSVMDVSNQGDNPFIALVSENTLKFIQFNNFGTFYLEKNLPTTDVYFVDYSIIKISPSSDRILLADRRNGILLLLDANGNTIKLLDGFDS
jgi:DNA-binding beta-propeller fold protein YncE